MYLPCTNAELMLFIPFCIMKPMFPKYYDDDSAAKKNLVNRISWISDEIDRVIAGTSIQEEYSKIYFYLRDALSLDISRDDFAIICDILYRASIVKNKTIRHLENDLWSFYCTLSYKYIMVRNNDIADDESKAEEELLPNIDYDNPQKAIFSRMLGLAEAILALKAEKNKASSMRRTESLNLVSELNYCFVVPIAKQLFINSVKSTDFDERIAAKQGLYEHYEIYDDELEE